MWWRRKTAVVDEHEKALAEQQKRVDTAELALRLNRRAAEHAEERSGIPTGVRARIDDIADAFDHREVDRIAAEFERVARERRRRA